VDLGLNGMIKLGWICGKNGVYRVMVGKPEGKRPQGRPRRRCVDNVRTDLWREEGCVVSWWGNRRERDHWGDLGVNGLINLGWISGERGCIVSCWGNRSERDHWGN